MGYSAMKTRREFMRAGAGALAGGAIAAFSGRVLAKPAKPKVALIWSEGTAPKLVYPHDINAVVAEGLREMRGWQVRTASLDDPDQGLSAAALADVDVLVWWGHMKFDAIPDATVDRIVHRVREQGMGFVALHSAHLAKPFRALLGGVSALWAGGAYIEGKANRVVVAAPKHPIARGVREFTIPLEERYQGRFDVPAPETIVFDGIYEGVDGENGKGWQGLTWTVGKGRLFYFRPGHESYPIFFMPEVRRIMRNAVLWTAHEEKRI